MATAALDAKLVCRIKSSVAVDLSIFEDAMFTMDWVAIGKPHIIQRQLRDEYCVVLYNKECGVLDEESSKALHAMTKLSTLSVKSQAFVGMDTKVKGHCIVAVNILAPPGLAQMVISTIVSCYGSNWSNYLTISQEFAKDRCISKLLWNLKRPYSCDNVNKQSFSSSKSHSTSNIETARKRIKFNKSSSQGNIADSFSRGIPIVDLTSANGTTNKTQLLKDTSFNFSVVNSSNKSKSSIVSTNNEERPEVSDQNILRDKTDSLLKNIKSQLSSIYSGHNKLSDKNDSLLKKLQSPQSSIITHCIDVSPVHVINEVSHSSKNQNITNCIIQGINSKGDRNSSRCPGNITPNTNSATGSISSQIQSNAANTLVSLGEVKQDVKQEPASPQKLITYSQISHSSVNQNITNCVIQGIYSKRNRNSSKFPENVIPNTNSGASSISSSQIASTGANIVLTGEVKLEPASPQKLIKDSKVDTSVALGCTNNTGIHGTILNDQLSHNTTVDGEPTKTSDLPDNIKKRLEIIDSDNFHTNNTLNNVDDDGLPNLMDESGTKTIIGFLLRRTPAVGTSNSQHNPIDVSSASNSISSHRSSSANVVVSLSEVKQEPASPQKLITDSKVDTSIALGCTNNTGIHGTSLNDQLSHNTTIDGEPTKTSDLPDTIKKRLEIIDRYNIRTHSTRNNKDDNGLPNLMDERGATNICKFLLGRTPAACTSSNSQHNSIDIPSAQVKLEKPAEGNLDINDGDDDDDDDLNFPVDFLSRRHKKRHLNPFADIDELPKVTIEVNSEVITVPDNSEPTIIKDDLDDIFDLMSEFPKNIEAEPCQDIKCVMLPHQKVALNWMMLRENSNELPPFWECIREGSDYFNLGTRRRIYERPNSINGGILADDMGLGKTLIAIALILTNHIGGKTLAQQKNILPVDASEICGDLKVTKKKKKSIKSSSATKSDFKKPGFLFRQMYLENITRKKVNGHHKIKQEEKMFSSDIDDDNVVVVDSIINKLQITSDSSTSCSSKFSDNDKNTKSSLIVCPMSVLSNWTDQLKEHVNPSLKLQIYLYYGPERIRDVNYLKKHDIVITTYGTLSCDYRIMNSKGKSAPLHNINWLRVVLDEGHIIRNFRSQQAVAAVHLNASRRWILTGTVIQNRMTDLWSMIKFLHIEPFTNRKWWNNHVSKSMERKAGTGEIWFNRIQKIVKHIAIRRLKTDKVEGKPLVHLPKREVVIHWVNFSEEERKIYDAMQKDGKFIVSRYFQMNTIFKNYANVLVIIMRLRQLCCHPKLCTKAIEKLNQAHNIMDLLKEKIDDINQLDADLGDDSNAISEEDNQKLVAQIMMFLASGDSEECSICLEILRDPVITRCAHIYCSTCINEVIENSETVASCPLCRSDIEQNTLLSVPLDDELENDKSLPVEENDVGHAELWQSSAKIDSLLEFLTNIQREEPDVKSLVVSQFTSFLDILEKPLENAGFQFVRLDGRMKQAARVQVMEEFKETDSLSPTIMLLSLTAGGVGLNLTSASRVFLLDPAWNPAVEEQCFDRCHRLGQTRDVKIYKFIVKDTVEDRMLILQDKKRKLMEKAFGGIKQTAEQRREAALRDISTLLDLNLPHRNIRPS